jgi:hypothetical protein
MNTKSRECGGTGRAYGGGRFAGASLLHRIETEKKRGALPP